MRKIRTSTLLGLGVVILFLLVPLGQALVIPAPSINADIDINPDKLNLKSRGRWITCYIELPDEYSVENIIVASILLNGMIPADPYHTAIVDHNSNGIYDLMVKFSRQDLINSFNQVGPIDLFVTGELTDYTLFEGTDTITVK